MKFPFRSIGRYENVNGEFDRGLARRIDFSRPDDGLVTFPDEQDLGLGHPIRIGHGAREVDRTARSPGLLTLPRRGIHPGDRGEAEFRQVVIFNVHRRDHVSSCIAFDVHDGNHEVPDPPGCQGHVKGELLLGLDAFDCPGFEEFPISA